ncbi:hypothetical protein DFH28DRAFT_1081533 [Melampsora americana]|nr:hypothetical protein DFH28DRAFT_1081533 [Melampsora americana]
MWIVTMAQASSDEYFVQCTSGPRIGHWLCQLCTGQTLKDKIKHSKLRTNVDRVRDENNIDIFGNDMAESSNEMASLYDPFHPNNSAFCPPPASREDSLDLGNFLENNSNPEIDSQPMPEPVVAATGKWLPCADIGTHLVFYLQNSSALLMLGAGRNLMSTAEYNCLRSILRRVLRACLGLQFLEGISPLGTPCFTLSVCDIISQELSHPGVSSHMEFLPEKDTRVTVDHYFFYKDKLSIHAKCSEMGDQGSHDFLIPAEPKFDVHLQFLLAKV